MVRIGCGRSSFSLLLVALAVAFLTACKVEEEFKLKSDGSGSYQATVWVPTELAEVLADVKRRAHESGMRIVQEGQANGGSFATVAKRFAAVNQLANEKDSYGFEAEQVGLFRRDYQLTLRLGSASAASGFAREIRVTMPAAIESASAGTVTGRTVVWDCSSGGQLTVHAAGFGVPLTTRHERAILVVAILGALLLVAFRLRGRHKARLPDGRPTTDT